MPIGTILKTAATSPGHFVTTRAMVAMMFTLQSCNILSLGSATGILVGTAGLVLIAAWGMLEYRLHCWNREKGNAPMQWEYLSIGGRIGRVLRRAANSAMCMIAAFMLGIFVYYILIA